MKKPDKFEKGILAEYDKGEFTSTAPSKAKLAPSSNLTPRSSGSRQKWRSS